MVSEDDAALALIEAGGQILDPLAADEVDYPVVVLLAGRVGESLGKGTFHLLVAGKTCLQAARGALE